MSSQHSTGLDLKAPDGSLIKWLNKSHKLYFNKTTLLYGRTGSGKTTIIDEIMYLCKSHISTVFVICKSEASNDAYKGKVPSSCIKNSVSNEWMENFLTTQRNRTTLYNKVNDIESLRKVFNKIKNANQAGIENAILEQAKKALRDISLSKVDMSTRKAKEHTISEMRDNALRKVYKNAIRASAHLYKRSVPHHFTEDEMLVMQFVHFHPHAMLIFDDCASNFKKWVKQIPGIKDLFYMGRHFLVTMVITAQDDKDIDSELRKNARVNIYTTPEVAMVNFQRATSGISKNMRKKVEMYTNTIFSSDNGMCNFRKLVFLPEDSTNPFYYTIANLYEPFKIGCDALWDLDKKMKEKNSSNDEDVKLWASKYIS